MIDHSEKKAILKKILESDTFNRGDKYSQLLTYLVESTLCGKIPKEYSIAVDVFDKDQDFNPSEDTTVRYHMYHLRKKIENYYENEGQHDKIRLLIPKGHYEVQFDTESGTKLKLWRKLGKRERFYLAVILMAVGIALFFCLRHISFSQNARLIEHPIAKDDPIWSSFFENRLPTLLIIGDHLLIREYDHDARSYREQYIYNLKIPFRKMI